LELGKALSKPSPQVIIVSALAVGGAVYLLSRNRRKPPTEADQDAADYATLTKSISVQNYIDYVKMARDRTPKDLTSGPGTTYVTPTALKYALVDQESRILGKVETMIETAYGRESTDEYLNGAIGARVYDNPYWADINRAVERDQSIRNSE
jgi:hypothetical protein